MRVLLIYFLAPFLLFCLILLGILIRIAPLRWRIGLLGFAALLISGLPSSAIDDTQQTVKCYRKVAVESNEQLLINTEEWQIYRTSYLRLLDYMVLEKFDEQIFQARLKALTDAEKILNQRITDEFNLPVKVVNALHDGITTKTDFYYHEQIGLTCYSMAMTPELQRNFAFADVVRQQMELRKMFYANTPISPETVGMIKQGMYDEAGKYLSNGDFALYKNLIWNLVQFPE